MPRPLREWKVLPHGKLSVVDDNLLSVVGELPMPIGDFPRRMTVARLQDDRLVIFSAIALDEDEMRALEEFGQPAFLVVPSDRHRMDAKIWKDRYPAMVVLTPPGARKKVEEVVPVDATSLDFGDPTVQLVAVPGTEEHEAALVVQSAGGTTLIVNELIWNVDHRPGFGGWLMKVTGMTSDKPQIPAIPKLLGFKDQPALRRQLEAWAGLDNLRRIIVSHGHIIESRPDQVLRGLAQELAA